MRKTPLAPPRPLRRPLGLPRSPSTAAGTDADRTRALLRELLSEVSRRPFGANDVLLDVVVEGVRCVLTRSQLNTPAGRAVISPREIEIARMVAKGLPSKAIASVLEISPWTVSTYLRRMFLKLGVRSRPALVARLVGDGTLRQ